MSETVWSRVMLAASSRLPAARSSRRTRSKRGSASAWRSAAAAMRASRPGRSGVSGGGEGGRGEPVETAGAAEVPADEAGGPCERCPLGQGQVQARGEGGSEGGIVEEAESPLQGGC